MVMCIALNKLWTIFLFAYRPTIRLYPDISITNTFKYPFLQDLIKIKIDRKATINHYFCHTPYK